MSSTQTSRRRFLAALGVGSMSLVAGCTGLGTDSQPSTPSRQETETDGVAQGTNLYDQTIDSVPLIRAFGLGGQDSDEMESRQGQGSGFVFRDSYVITNEHVVSGAAEVDLQYTIGDWSKTTIIGTDVRSDLAVLKPDFIPETTPSLSFSQQRPEIGQDVKAIGNPFGLEGSISTGIISGIDRSVFSPMTGVSIPHAIQTDAAINPGNSGGPLVDLDGEVVGVISAGGGQNIGFAISSALSRRVIPALIDDGVFHHSFLGANHITVDPFVAEANDREDPGGALVVNIVDNGPADGILRESPTEMDSHGESIPVGGDIVLEVNGDTIPDQNSLTTFLALETSPGEDILLTIDRNGRIETVEVTLGSRPTA